MKTIVLICLLVSILTAKVSESTDSFTGITTNSTDILRSTILYLKTDSVTEYILNLEVSGSTVIYDGVGAFIQFKDGSLWERENKAIKCTYSNGFKYYAYIHLTLEEAKLFSEKEIEKIKLYVFEKTISESKAVQFKSEVFEILGDKK